MKKILLLLLPALLLTACGQPPAQNSALPQVVTTDFPAYDFARAVCGDTAEVTLLLSPGAESHSYEPTPADILAVQNCDLFVYLGGESDVWVDTILETAEPTGAQLRMVDCVPLLEEESVQGGHDDHDGHDHGLAIPPDRIRPDVVAAMRQDAERLLAPPFAEAVRKTQSPFLQAIFDLAVPTMAVGRVALLGDAAFVARPHVGMGVTKAAGDAVALARCLAEAGDIDRGLAAYDRDRRPYGMRVIRRARHLGAYLQAQLHSPEERARAEAHRSPEAVMTETAVMAGIDSW